MGVHLNCLALALTSTKRAFETNKREVPSGDQGRMQEEPICETCLRSILSSDRLPCPAPLMFSLLLDHLPGKVGVCPGFAQSLVDSASLPAAFLSPSPQVWSRLLLPLDSDKQTASLLQNGLSPRSTATSKELLTRLLPGYTLPLSCQELL